MHLTKSAYTVALLIVGLGLALGLVTAVSGCGQNSNSDKVAPQAKSSVDPDPTGTWTEGDRNSVYNRLTVRSSGRFSFETVDFSGDVKGGYSGRWKMNGNSIRFEWGSGGADSGSCSGRRTGRNSLVFGATTFSR